MLLVVRVQTRGWRRRNNEFWMNMKVITTRMMMMKRTNLRESKKEQECPE